jgi:hypothetical protein
MPALAKPRTLNPVDLQGPRGVDGIAQNMGDAGKGLNWLVLSVQRDGEWREG